MKKLFQIFLLLLMFIVPVIVFGAESSKFYTITCNPGEETSTEMRINWHTDVEVTNSYVLYTTKDDKNWEQAIKAETDCKQNDAFTQLNAIGSVFNQNGAVLSNLIPDTDYMYKITDGTEESDVRYFKTSGANAFSFIWTSDFHAYYDDARRLNNATANIEEAIKMNNGVDFILSTGDTVAHGGTYKWWKQVFEASWMKNYMYIDTLGNHDWMTSSGTYVSNGASNIFFGATHNNPKNGYAGQENICYYFYYGDVLFIVLNTEEYSQAQYDWAESVLKEANAQYIFMVQHYEMFTPTGGKKSSGYNRWHELCDKYGVDIFFSGNSHSYIRSNPIYQDKVSTDKSKGTVYMVAPSSDGDRGVSFSGITNNTDLIAKGWAGGTYQVACSLVTVSSSGITTKLINKGGEVLDVGVISAKRAPTSRTIKDLSNVNKEEIESSIALSTNSKDMSAPRVKYHEETPNAVRKMTIKDTVNNKVLFEGQLAYNSRYFNLENIAKGFYNLDITLEYYDNTTKIINLDFANAPRWGSISTIVQKEVDGSLSFTWKETIDKDVVSKLELCVNDEVYQEIEIGAKKAVIDNLPSGKSNISIKVYDVENVLIGKVLLAEYEKIVPTYTVVFKDLDGNVLSESVVEEGQTAIAPIAPEIDGMVFYKWDKEFTSITENLEILPIYEKDVEMFNVTFLDNDGNIFKTERVEINTSATAPELPLINGYEHIGWDVDFSSVTSDLTVTPIYEVYRTRYTVTFVDEKDNVLKEEIVKEGDSATAPTPPSKEGYAFVKWDTDFTNVNKDLTVKTIYNPVVTRYIVTFKGFDGEVLKTESVEINKSATAPDAPEVEGYEFVKWDVKFDNVKEDLIVQAIYEKPGCGNSASILFTSLMLLGLCFIRRKRY